MDKPIVLDGKKYISAKNAADLVGYTSDYVGQLCRGKQIEGRRMGRNWYVLERDIINHKNSHNINFGTVRVKKNKKSVSKKNILLSKSSKSPKLNKTKSS